MILVKRMVKFSLAALALLLLSAGGAAVWVLSGLPDVAPLKNRNLTLTIEVPDWQGKMHPFLVGPKNRYWVPLAEVPVELKWAVIAAEDASFYLHKGIDVEAIREALEHDLKNKRLERGASTITQQLAKNLFLSRDKSLLRKLREAVIARRLEAELTKGRILELYLNIVELGPLVYGVGHGAEYHFAKPVQQLTPAESAILAAILPGPRIAYNPKLKPERVQKRAARLVGLLGVREILDDDGVERAMTELGPLLGLQRPEDVSLVPGEGLEETVHDDEDLSEDESDVIVAVPSGAGDPSAAPESAVPTPADAPPAGDNGTPPAPAIDGNGTSRE